ncbi:flippase [Pseudomonas sp. KSR10]|jgi:O-antigen/teichoic acid export membrane protein|uniref:Polysaccharide biosynthesis protein n=1 Tax=Stutzerimonas stutzeri TaxID=316 RepID=A0A0D9AK03_STUST|nr:MULTISPECIES: flippase [Pseudomonadaceae]KJH79691.1 polysaccharide biosynthesis protein [Stutzerimonas stutzeri]MCG6541315.1 flippase [Pseudomonas sp. KSR10]
MTAIRSIFDKLKLYFFNASWMMAERLLNIGVGFVMAIVLARYLGPEQFGILAYAISMTAIFASAGHMGLAGLVVREVVKQPAAVPETLGTTFMLKLSGMTLGFLLILIYASLFEKVGGTEFWMLLIVASAIFFQTFDVVEYWFQSQVQAKYPAIAKSSAILLSAGLKLLMVVSGAGVVAFAFAHTAQFVMAALILALLYKGTTRVSLMSWKASFARARELLSQGWIIYLGSIFAVVYMKIDQVMLKWMVGAEEVGVYAVAAQLSEAWYFLPTAIVASFFPKLIKLHEADPARFNQRFQQLFDLLFILAIAVALLVSLVAGPLISLLFGAEYQNSASILTIHIWAGVFIFMRAAFSRWILIEGALMFSLITQGLGALANVGLNALLIPHYGGEGAAMATLISYAVASYAALLVHSKTRPVFLMMTKSMVSPIRYAFKAVGAAR